MKQEIERLKHEYIKLQQHNEQDQGKENKLADIITKTEDDIKMLVEQKFT